MFNAIGAHIYAGGFTAGVSEHFNVLAHLEHAAYGADVVKLNFPGLPIYDGGPEKWPRSWPRGAERPRFLYANPPCAIWSMASSTRNSWRSDPRLQMHHDIFNFALDEVGVDVLSIESVPPSFTSGREHVDGLIAAAASRGYATTVVIHDAQYLGVAQVRKRIFYTFHKIQIPWACPEFGSPTTVRQALKGVKHQPGRGYDTTMPERLRVLADRLGPGGRLRTAFDKLHPDATLNSRGQISGRPSFLDARAPWDRPAGVLIAGKMIHPDESRFMAQEELAAICSFPKDYKWPKEDFGYVSGYMSRGVMPKVGAWLAENISQALTDNKRLNTQDANVLNVAKSPGALYPLEEINNYDENIDTSTGKTISTPVPTIARERILLTGSTPMQVGSQRTQLKIITAAESWYRALTDIGYDVDWRSVKPGEDLSEYTAAISILNKPNSIASSHFHGALWSILKIPRTIIAIDDWQTYGLMTGIQSCARSKERFFRLRGSDVDDDVKTELFNSLNDLANNRWRNPVIAPILGNGNVSLLDLPANIIAIDPTVYAMRYALSPSPSRQKEWVQASLLHKSLPTNTSWPISGFGFQDRAPGGVGPVGENSQPRIPEPELMVEYGRAWGVLSPAHPHAGSGWWRVRYLMAADAGCVLSADPKEAACLGAPYVEASDIRRVEKMSVAELTDLARRQAECLDVITWSKTRVKNALRKLLSGEYEMPPRQTIQATSANGAAPGIPYGKGMLPDVNGGEGSGAYIRRLLTLGFGSASILEAVHRQFPGSKATNSDVSYNKGILKKQGIETNGGVPPARSDPRPPVPTRAAPKYAVEQQDLPWETPTARIAPRSSVAAVTADVDDEAKPIYDFIRSKVSAARSQVNKKTINALADVADALITALEKL